MKIKANVAGPWGRAGETVEVKSLPKSWNRYLKIGYIEKVAEKKSDEGDGAG